MDYSTPCTLAFDLGTMGCKGVIVDDEGLLVAASNRKIPSITTKSGYLEHDPTTWWDALKNITREITRKIDSKDLKGLGLCGTMGSTLPIDKNRKQLRNALLYADMRAMDQANAISEEYGRDEIYKITGNPVSPVYSLSKWMWIRENEPKIFERTEKFLQPKDFIVSKLTGEVATDYVDASATMAFDVRKRAWVEDLLDFGGIPLDMLPEPHPSTDVIGELSSEASKELGLRRGIPVIMGCGDTAALLVGARAVDDGVGTVYLGAASEIDYTAGKPVFDPNAKIPLRCHAIPNMWFVSASAMTSGTALEWFTQRFCGNRPYTEMDKEALEIPVGSGGLIFLPYLSGERIPIWDPKARGAFIGINFTSDLRSFYRSILEGVAFSLRSILEAYKMIGVEFRELSISGGGANSEIWKRIVVNTLGIQCLDLVRFREVSALGVSILVNVALSSNENIRETSYKKIKIKGLINPEEVIKNAYDDFYRVYAKCYPALSEIMHELVDLNNYGTRAYKTV